MATLHTQRLASLFLAVTCTGCASLPDVNVGYYHAKVAVTVTVTQTAACTAADVPVLTSSVDVEARYSADSRNRATPVALKSLGGTLRKVEAGLDFHADGRLKGINTKGAGQAAEALKSVIAAADAMGPLINVARNQAACAAVRDAVGAGKALTVVHTGSTEFAESESTILLSQRSISDATFNTVSAIFGVPTAGFTINPARILHQASSSAKNTVSLGLIEPAEAVITIRISGAGRPFLQTTSVAVPQRGVPYTLPIQRAPLFGTNEFKLELAESGRVIALKYAGAGDVPGAAGVLAAAFPASPDPTLAQQADRAKAAADLIYQQQRLVLCQAEPKDCPK